MFLVECYFHDVVFTNPHEGLRSPIPFGFRPISLGAAINLGSCFLHSFLHEVRFNYYRLIYRFCPSWRVIENSITIASADFSQQALLRFFRKKKLFEVSVRPPRIRALSFHLIPTSFTPTIPNSYGTLICFAILSMVKCLI